MSRNRFTIITVCYNAEADIEFTIQSVLSQSFTDYEYIIKDGLSGDRTMDIVHSLTDNDNRVTIVRGKDRGIYDAMNIAVSDAHGEYIFFLNAGDVFHTNDILEKISEDMKKEHADVYYGNICQVSDKDGNTERIERIYSRKSTDKFQFAIGRCICHQAMFAKRKLLIDKQFDTSYRVCADREWQLFYLAEGKNFVYINEVICDVLVDGFSMNHVDVLEKETALCLQKYCKNYLWIYLMIMFLKKSHIIKKIMTKIDAVSATGKRETYE